MSDKTEIKELQETIATTFEELKTRNDTAIEEMKTRGGEATAETTAALEKANNEITELRKQTTEMEKRLNRPKFDQEGGNIDPEMEERQKVFEKFVRHGRDTATPEELRTLSNTSDSDGGIFIPPTFEKGIIMNAYDEAEVRPLCDVMKTGRDMVILGSMSKPTIAWGRKKIAVSEQDLSTGGKKIEIFFLNALVRIPIDTLEDAEANIIPKLIEAFGSASAEAEDDAFMIAAGDDSPKGLMTDATVQANYVASGVAAALSDSSNNGADAMLGAKYKIKKKYRKKAAWAMNSTTEGAIRILKDGNGRYLWQNSLQIGTPPTFDGHKIINPEGMADIGAGSFPILFGDFKGYSVRDRKGMSVQRLVEKYAEYGEIGLLVRKRVGGMLTVPEAFSCVKIAAN